MNEVIKDAVTAEFPNKLLFTRIAGTVIPNADLKNSGAGDTVTFSQFELGNTDLQVLNRGDQITTHELGQSQISFKIEQLAHGRRYFDQDIKYSLSGGSLAAESTKQIVGAYAHGLDELTIAAATNAAVVEDATAGLTTNLILDAATKQYGENVFDGSVAALVIHPTKLGELRQDPNFASVETYGRANAQFGNFEVGMLYGLIPVVISNKVMAGANAGEFKNLLVAKNSVYTLLGKDLNIENKREAEYKATSIFADMFVGIHAHQENKGIVFTA